MLPYKSLNEKRLLLLFPPAMFMAFNMFCITKPCMNNSMKTTLAHYILEPFLFETFLKPMKTLQQSQTANMLVCYLRTGSKPSTPPSVHFCDLSVVHKRLYNQVNPTPLTLLLAFTSTNLFQPCSQRSIQF